MVSRFFPCVLLLTSLLASCGAAAATHSAPPTRVPTLAPSVSRPLLTRSLPNFSHVFVIVLENHGFDDLLGSGQAPAIAALATRGAIAANYYGVAHPSEPNYLALIGGDTFGVNSDASNTHVNATTLVDQLEGAGRGWKAYMEDLPAPGSLVTSSDGYVSRHNPFVLFGTVTSKPARLKRVVPLSQLYTDLKSGGAPSFSFISPNLCHDLHDCSIARGDAFAGQLVSAIQSSPAWDAHAALFLVFDEDDDADHGGTCCGTQPGGGKVGALVVSPLARSGYISQAPYNHYSLLRTIEDAWQLPPLRHAADAGIRPMTDVFAAEKP